MIFISQLKVAIINYILRILLIVLQFISIMYIDFTLYFFLKKYEKKLKKRYRFSLSKKKLL